MISDSSLPSIHDNIPPLEEGGVIARDGFDFQDHVAVMLCLDMFTNSSLQEVRCENQDDITLLWQLDSQEETEFVQVKGNKLPHLWSVAELCKQEKNAKADGAKSVKAGSSILEKSLSNDRFKERSRFRIVTRLDVNDELAILKFPTGSPVRCGLDSRLTKLYADLRNRLTGFRSIKGNDFQYWAENTLWQVEHSTEAVIHKNKNLLASIIEQIGEALTLNQVEKAYTEMLRIVRNAALADWRVNGNAKRIRRDVFVTDLKQIIQGIRNNPVVPIGKAMEEKMVIAKIQKEYIMKAHEIREYYRREMLSSKYSSESLYKDVEIEIYAILQELLSKLDAGKISGSGVDFHNLCLEKLSALRDKLDVEHKVALAFFQGCMYYITGRCSHRFSRASYETNQEP